MDVSRVGCSGTPAPRLPIAGRAARSTAVATSGSTLCSARAYQNYLKITGDLQTQLQKAQDALNHARNRLDLFANNAYGLKRPTIKTVERIANEALEKIASITKQENE